MDVHELDSVRSARRQPVQGCRVERQLRDDPADAGALADELNARSGGVTTQAPAIRVAVDLEQQIVSASDLLEGLRVTVADRGLQTRRRGCRDGAYLLPVAAPGKPSLGALGGVVYLEVDGARDVADLVSDDHVGDQRDREDRDRRQGEHQPQTEAESERRRLALHETQSPWPWPCEP